MDNLIFLMLTALISFFYLTDTSSLGSSGSSKPQTTPSSSQSLCGVAPTKSGLGNKIVGGNTSNIEFHPWYAALANKEGDDYIVSCGATLITSTHLITAAHCYEGNSNSAETRYRIVFNLQNRCNGGGGGHEVLAKSVIIHKKYGKGSDLPENDIAMIVLLNPVSNTPICLPSKGIEEYAGKEALIIGYGSTKVRSSTNQTYPCRIREAKITIFSANECLKSGLGTNVARKAFCAGRMEGKIDACDGDSGGPLMVKVDDKYELLGVTSYGEGCGRKNLPGVYTDISAKGQGNWIIKKVKETSSAGSLPSVPKPDQQSGSSSGGQGSSQKPSKPPFPEMVHFGTIFPGLPSFLLPNFSPRPPQSISIPAHLALLNALLPVLPQPPMVNYVDFMNPLQQDLVDFGFY